MSGAVSVRHPGIALRCASNGTVLEIICDSLGAKKCLEPNEPFASLLDSASRLKAEAFFAALREQKSAFNWELNVPCGEDSALTPMHFAGIVNETSTNAPENAETFLIIGAKSRNGVSRFYDELVRSDAGRTGALRFTLDDLEAISGEQAERDNFQYDELSRLNNELATVQRELAKKNVELARLNEQKNQFLGIAAHDLRNPLEVVLTYSEFLLEDAAPVLEEEQIDFVRKIHSSSAFMLNLVNDFLDFSKIEAGRLELDLADADAVVLVRRVVESARVLADKKQIRVNLKEGENLPPVNIDAPKIEQVLNNLIGNALKFSRPGGEISVSVLRKDDRLVFSVGDEGPGIAPGEAESLFNPFVKGATKTTGGEKSTGLGLAIVKKIVERHEGEILLETEIGKGTTFRVSLPLKIEPKK